ncbi:LTA synthase family protein [Bacillus sp. FJAT-29937]|uniref:LTA synthase family protein n=1 Tax=Bacillus sp. FJAT-29937 TaxID=1720553 RepID=UPI000829EBAD|nr:LTA synthase family protein [Bacillus sp. FJAT-29937]
MKKILKSLTLYRSQILILIPLILLFFMEYLSRQNFNFTISWFLENQREVLLNYLLILQLLVIVVLVTNMFYGIFIITVSLTVFSFINGFKLKILGQPILPRDILRIKEMVDILPLLIDYLFVIPILVIPLIIVFFLMRKFIKVKPLNLVPRLLISAVLVVTFITFFVFKPSFIEKVYQKYVSFIIWDQKENYLTNGFLLSFTSNIEKSIIYTPKGYSKETVKLNYEDSLIMKPSFEEKPNLIIVMNESFWDPTVLENIEFSSDPIPFFRSLKKESTSGWLLSPQFGGGTVNVEFEILTGHSISFLPFGSIAFQQYINKPTMTLASILKSEGYSTVGIHSYKGWFYNRENIYKLLGFDSFISSEYFVDPVYKGPFISDMEVSKKIINEIERRAEPSFVYAITMQNHGPYGSARYKENNILVKADISNSSKAMLETYAQGLYDADRSLELLINYFENSKEPTVVMFFGDHLPLLGDEYMVYKESQFIRDENILSLNDTKKLHSVPFVIWSNYNNESKYIENYSTSFIGPYLLNEMSIDLPPYFKYIKTVSEKMPGLSKSINIDNKGKIYKSIPNNYKKMIDKYWYLQYDQLFGKRYTSATTFINNNYNQDIIPKVEITKASIEEVRANQLFNPWEGESAIAIMGENFIEGCSIYINDKEIKTTFGSSNLLTGIVPLDFYKKPGELIIDVKLKGSSSKIIAESNKITIPVIE